MNNIAVSEINFKITADISQLRKAVTEAREATKSATKPIANSFSSMVGQLKTVSSPISKLTSGFGGLAKTAIKVGTIGVAMKGVNSALNAVTSSVGSAISRIDTLNNSSRVFENMGFSAGESSEMMKNLTNSLKGLPTGLDSAVQGVQLLAASTGNLGKSQEIFSALNNGILGFGGSTEQVQNAITQLSQAFSNSKVDAETWNSMIDSGLGPALNALAKQMGMTTGELKAGLSDGSVSVETFQNGLINLNEHGGGGLKSLQKIAKDSTAGIGSSIENAKTAITRGVASMIKAFDDFLVSVTGMGIAEIVSSIGTSMEKWLGGLASLLQKLTPIAKTVFEAIKKGMTTVSSVLKSITLDDVVNAFQKFMNILKTLAPVIAGVIGAIVAIKVITTVVSVISAVGAAIAFLTSPIGLVVLAIGALIAIGVLVWQKWDAISQFLVGCWNGIKEFAVGIWDGLKAFFSTTIGQIVLAIINPIAGLVNIVAQNWTAIKTTTIAVWNSIKVFLSAVWTGIKNVVSVVVAAISSFISNSWNTIKSVTSAVWNGIKAVISTVWNAIKSAVSSAINAVKSVVSKVWNGIKSVTSSVWNGIKSTISNVWNGIKSGVSNAVNTVKSTVSNVFNGLKSTVTSVWNGIKTAITRPIEAAKNTVKNIVDKIKGLFKFKLKFPSISIPHIPLPHFKLSGSFNPLKGKIPSVGIDWYKTGGIFTGASVIGVGEAGDEAVVPLSNKSRMAPFAKAVSDYMNKDSSSSDSGNGAERPLIVHTHVFLNGREIAVAATNAITERQQRLARAKSRRDGIKV